MFVSSDGVLCVAFDPQKSNILASCSDDKTIKIWDIESGSCLSTLTGHSAAVRQLEFRDPTTLVSASDDGTTRFWDVESGVEQGQDAQGTHDEALAGERFAFSKPSSTKQDEQVVGSFIVKRQGAQGDNDEGAQGNDHLVLVYEVVADKQTPVAFFAAPSPIESFACAGDKIAVGLQNGGVLLLRAALLTASEGYSNKQVS